MSRQKFEEIREDWKQYEATKQGRIDSEEIDWLLAEVEKLRLSLSKKADEIEAFRENKIAQFEAKVAEGCDAYKANPDLKKHNLDKDGDTVIIDFSPALVLKSQSKQMKDMVFYLLKQKMEDEKFLYDGMAERLKTDITDCLRGQGTFGKTF